MPDQWRSNLNGDVTVAAPDPIADALWATRRRWAMVVAAIGAAIQVIASFAPGVGAWQLATRAASCLVCLAAWRAFARVGPDRLLLRAAFIVFEAQQLSLVWQESSGSVPSPIWGVPLIPFLAVLFDGPRFGAVLALVALSVLGAGLLVVPTSPLLLHNSLNTVLACIVLQLFAVALVTRLREGASELADSVAALREASDKVRALQQVLSERIAGALAAVEAAVEQHAASAESLASELGASLREARLAVGPGIALPPAELPDRLAQLRLSVGIAMLAVVAGAMTPLALFLAWRGPRENLELALLALALTAAFGVARLVFPSSAKTLIAAYLTIFFVLVLYTTVLWFSRTAELPPSVHGLVIVALIGTGGVGLPLGLLVAGVGAIVMAVGIHQHPGLPPFLPINFALGVGAACVAADRLPKELLQQLQRWQQQADAEIQHHRRLAATLFHDLANPLTVIQMLLADARSAEEEQRLRAMLRRMRLVLDTALGGPDAPQALDASVLVGELEQLFREKLQRKRLRLRVDLPAGARLWASAPILRESVLGNLLSNAIKFSAPGSEIELRVVRDGGEAVITVDDRGPGVPPDVRAAVVERREAPSRPGSEGEQGSGFGLMLAAEYLTAMRGTLELADRLGGGTSVRVRLPLAPAEAPG